MSNTVRRGFSLLDVIILVAILAVVVTVLLPAIQRMGDSAQKGETQNNLRKCAIGIHSYHGVFNRIPNAAWRGGIYSRDGEERSMWFHILPFLEQDADYKLDVVYKDNVHNAVIDAYLTPDDNSKEDKAGKINFAANLRIFGYETLTAKVANSAVDDKTGNPTGTSLSGKLAGKMKSGLTLARISDGTSNVILLSTRYRDCGSPMQSTYYSAAPNGELLAGGGKVAGVGVPKAGKGAFFAAGSHHKAPGDSIDAMYQVMPKIDKCLADDAVFGHSFDDKGLRVAMADASVRSISATISATTFCRVLCPSDGFALDNDWGN
jgi:type II secretory pathway pseudopilin PulG